MEISIKIIVTSKSNLQIKYGNKFSEVKKLLSKLVAADKINKLNTKVVYIDDDTSAKKADIKVVGSVTRQSCKKAVDDLFKKWQPSYIVLFGAQDIIPFQEIVNPVDDREEDEDIMVPSDLPYACDKPYNTSVSAFTGPTRIVGRIPDIPGQADLTYLKIVIDTIIKHKRAKAETYLDYFAVTAAVWRKSTEQSLTNIFGNSAKLKDSPPAGTRYAVANLKPLTHFYNCHGSPSDSKYYGQIRKVYPTAIHSPQLIGKISKGAIVAAECCYGAEVYNPIDADDQKLSIPNTYFQQKALAFVGSSTIAFGPPDGQGCADLITQYFIKSVLAGASSGRAMLEARQKFLSVCGPDLDPYQEKTLAQFYLLGDPSIHAIAKEVKKSEHETVKNRRMSLFSKGTDLSKGVNSTIPLTVQKSALLPALSNDMNEIFKKAGFTGKETEIQYVSKPKGTKSLAFTKRMTGSEEVVFRTFTKKSNKVREKVFDFKVLVVKQSGNEILSSKVYYCK